MTSKVITCTSWRICASLASQRHCEKHEQSMNKRNRRGVICYTRRFNWLSMTIATQIGVTTLCVNVALYLVCYWYCLPFVYIKIGRLEHTCVYWYICSIRWLQLRPELRTRFIKLSNVHYSIFQKWHSASFQTTSVSVCENIRMPLIPKLLLLRL